ncbi:ADP-ribose pyrophosphatase [Boudabousia liubingyangii]|uniref:NUDIX hydrolase n=1 Tax=Boudabousia liubingyangii TaxID=1921764 RepID=UPI000938FC7B|nr:NUDIX domain-containing protein [Boudabousia liubingyangii]OKL46286.1 ADP-ribose pyrophosphatase [Boudabousia liubingyangii]
MATPDFVLELRKHVGHARLWMPGITAVILRPHQLPADQALPTELPEGPLDPTQWDVLVVRRSDNGNWTPVTGIVDPGEEPAVAGIREALEETGINVIPQRLLSTQVVGPVIYANGDDTIYLDLAFSMLVAESSRNTKPWPADGENTECAFVRADQLPPMNERFTEIVRQALENQPSARFHSH